MCYHPLKDSYLYFIDYNCEEITVGLCHDIGYHTTSPPNILGHFTQADAEKNLNKYSRLINLECSKYLREFLCSVFVPKCNYLKRQHIPCRSLCEDVQSGCKDLVNEYNVPWPSGFKCSDFPEGDDCYAPWKYGKIILPSGLLFRTILCLLGI